MFGLMRAKSCGMTAEERRARRLNYFGTGKTIGGEDSAKARVLLNNDVVFFAGLLTELGGEETSEWGRAYQSYNCLSLPQASMPDSLKFAAATNIILTRFKIADHIEDGQGIKKRTVARILSGDFARAEKYLCEKEFPVAEIEEILSSQGEREGVSSSLDELAFPTARTTGIFFREGLRLVGRGDVADRGYELGFEFGKLIYLVDAFEDYQSDARQGQFNAISAIYGTTGDEMPDDVKREVRALFGRLEERVIESMD